MVTRRVEAAQKKVEERHFDSRKNLLEYDELMDDQRQQVYAYRQKILDGANCRELIIDMMKEQVSRWVPYFLEPNYRWNTIAEWSSQTMQTSFEAHKVKGMTFEQLTKYIKEESLYRAEIDIEEQLEVNLPLNDEEGERNWNWNSVSRWANSQFGINTNESELKKTGREEILNYLRGRAKEGLERIDFTQVQAFLEDDWGQHSLCAWLLQQFTLEVKTEEFAGMDDPQKSNLSLMIKYKNFIKRRKSLSLLLSG